MTKLQKLKDTVDKELATSKEMHKVGIDVKNSVMQAHYAGKINILEWVIKPLVDEPHESILDAHSSEEL